MSLMGAVAARRMAGYYQAQELQHLAEFAYLEVSTLLHIFDRTAQARLVFAQELTERLPAP